MISDFLPLNGSGQAILDGIVEAGGTFDDYKDFRRLARENSMMVDSTEHSLELVSTQKRNRKNSNTLPSKPPKLSKSEVTLKNQKVGRQRLA